MNFFFFGLVGEVESQGVSQVSSHLEDHNIKARSFKEVTFEATGEKKQEARKRKTRERRKKKRITTSYAVARIG